MFLYRLISVLIYPILVLYLFIRVLKGKDDKKRFLERLAIPSKKRGEGDLIWIHAVSVGETNSAMILVDELLKNQDLRILFTTSSLGSAKVLGERIEKYYKDRLIHQFLPYDSLFIVKKFLNYWKPKKALFFEAEVWVNFILESRKRDISTFLVNARISENSLPRWNLAKKIGINIFDYFNNIFAQSKSDQKRLSSLTKNDVQYYGNLKLQADKLKYDEEELEKLKKQISNRKFWIAASTHKGEEEIIISAHKKLRQKFSDLLLILIPRHPVRAPEIIPLMKDFNFSQRSLSQEILPENEIYFADSLGEIGLFYKLSDFVFLAGSLKDIGGHNPFEPIRLGSAVISGRSGIFNFQEIYQDLEKQGAAMMVDGENELVENVSRFLDDSELTKFYIEAGQEYIKKSGEITNNIIANLGL